MVTVPANASGRSEFSCCTPYLSGVAAGGHGAQGLCALERRPAQAPCGPSVPLFTCAVCPPGFPYEKVVQRILYLQVLDYDRFSRNDPIGEVSIPLNKVDLTQMQTFWKDLKPCSDGSVRPHLWAPGLGSWQIRAGRSGPSPPATLVMSGGWWGRCKRTPRGAEFPPLVSAPVLGPWVELPDLW